MFKKWNFTMLLMLIGAGNITAQSISSAQMDERFNNDDKLPYGWYTEGWEVKDGVAQTKSSSSGFDISQLMGGGSSSVNYLMTPPVSVQGGEVLSFSAKKGDGGNAASSFVGGGSGDSTLVVERAVYGEFRWVKVAEFTKDLSSKFQTFTISDTEAGEYRFRFRAGGDVQIDSVAGFHIDSAAPDVYPIYQKKNIQPVDLGLCAEDTTMTFSVVNTGTGTLDITLDTKAAPVYTLDQSQLSIASGDTVDVKVTFNYGQSHEGRNSAMLTFTAADTRIEEIPLPIDAVVAQAGVWTDDFNNNALSEGWFTEGWEARDGVATVKSTSDDGGMGGMFGGGSATYYYLMTPPLTVYDENDVLLFSVKKPDGGGMNLGGMFGGDSGSSFFIEKSVYGSGKWEKAKDFSNAVDTVFTAQWLSGLEPGEYRFRFMASDSIVIDSVAGFHIDMNAPDLYVTLDSATVRSLELGTLRADSTITFTAINTGTGTLQLNVSSSDEKRIAIAQPSLSIAAGDSVFVDATMLRDDMNPGEIRESLTFEPADERVLSQKVDFHAYIIKSDVWKEDFEPYYVIEDRTFPRRFPEGWTTTGWELTDGEGGFDMMALMGGGTSEPKSWGATSDSEAYELITPRLQANQGEVLQFHVDAGGGGGYMAMFGMGGGSDARVNLYYKRDYTDEDWMPYDTYSETGDAYFKAPYTGIYRLKFVGSSVTLDDFEGFHAPLKMVYLVDEMDDENRQVIEENSSVKRNVIYDRVLSALDNGDGTWTPDAYTICLPYDMDFNAYNEPGKVKLYRLKYIDRYYSHFVFTEAGDTASAGVPYLAVVFRDSVSLNAYGVAMTTEANQYAGEEPLVYDYEKWHFEGVDEMIGHWYGSFYSRAFDDENAALTYGLTYEGSWVRVSQAEEPLPGFRAFYFASTDTLADEFHRQVHARAIMPVTRSVDTDKSYQTKFYQQDENDVDNSELSNLRFHGDITVAAPSVTGFKPTFQTVDADGTSRYFDFQGRQLNGKPDKGYYIKDGIKRVAP